MWVGSNPDAYAYSTSDAHTHSHTAHHAYPDPDPDTAPDGDTFADARSFVHRPGERLRSGGHGHL